MRVLRLLLTFLATLLLLPFLLETGVYLAASRTVLDAAFYHRLFDQAGVYDRLPEDLARFVSENTEIPEPFKGVSGEIAREVITPSRLREQAPWLLRAALGYLKGEADAFQLPVSLAKLRVPLEESLARRLPPGLAGVARDAVAELPDEYDVSPALGPDVALSLDRMRAGVIMARLVALLTPVLGICLSVLVWLVNGRRLSAVILWLGATIFLAGVFVIAAAVVPVSLPLGPSGTTLVTSWLTGLHIPARFPGFDQKAALAFLQNGIDTVARALKDEGVASAVAGAALLGAGLMGRLLGRWLTRRRMGF